MLVQESRMRSFSTDKSPAKVVTYLLHMLHAELLIVLLRLQLSSGQGLQYIIMMKEAVLHQWPASGQRQCACGPMQAEVCHRQLMGRAVWFCKFGHL